MVVAGLAMSLGCTSAQAASPSELMPACKLYLSVVIDPRWGSLSIFAIALVQLARIAGHLQATFQFGVRWGGAPRLGLPDAQFSISRAKLSPLQVWLIACPLAPHLRSA